MLEISKSSYFSVSTLLKKKSLRIFKIMYKCKYVYTFQHISNILKEEISPTSIPNILCIFGDVKIFMNTTERSIQKMIDE